jgi:long-chain acyl-CoA synthetase
VTTIPALFANAVARFPTRTALIQSVEGNELTSLSYEDMQTRIQAFAGYLQKQPLAKGDRILLWSPSRSEWLIAYFAALLLGLVVVPLDSNSKEDFIQRIQEISDARYLITTQKLYATLKQPPIPLIDIESLPEGTIDASQLPTIAENDLAQLVFTSGTTGQPKGVMLSHNNIASNALASLQVIDIRETDRALSILPLSHMFEMTIDIAILSTGASILYARSLVPDTLLKLLATQRITVMVLVPQALQLFMHGIEREVRRQGQERLFALLHKIAAVLPFELRRYLFGPVHKRFSSSFRFFVSGGAYLPPLLAQRWEEMGFRVMPGYGATECAPVISVTRMDDHSYESVGNALPGITVRIEEDHEIVVRGPNVALGYWQNSEATDQAFRDGWYYTGDLGYLDEKQRIYIKGRKKNLIVLANGLNVYPEDVENVLLNHADLKDAVVIGLDKENKDPEVHAVLLLEDSAKAKTIVQQANKQLASHQQVRGFTIWPERDFPRTHTLKVKRQEVMADLPKIRQEIKKH